MSTATVSLSEIAAQWRAARRIYPVYATVVRQFDLGIGPCRDLESPIDRNDPVILERIAKWFDGVDGRCQPFQLRQVLQTGHMATEENLRALARRFLDKEKKSGGDRDKIDFLLVQYFAQHAPHSMHNRPLELDDVAEVLEPVLGETVPHQPRWLDVLDQELEKVASCATLGALIRSGVLAHVHQLKEEAEEMYFGSGAMLAFTRFNFAARHTFFRLLHTDLQAMRKALHELVRRGIRSLDGTGAGLSAEEPLASVHRVCHDWKTPFRAPYAAGKPFEQMVALYEILDAAMAAPYQEPEPAPVAAEPQPEMPQVPEPMVEAPGDETCRITTIPEQPAATEPVPSAGDTAHEITLETPEGKIPTGVMEAAAAAAIEGPSTAEIPVYQVEEHAAPADAPKPAVDLQACLEHIAEQLIGDVQPLPTSVATVYFNDAKVILSSWEVAAFVKGGNDTADALQRAVAARTILMDAVDRKKKGIRASDLPEAIKLAHVEAGLLQEKIAEAKDAKNIDAAVNLAATCKRLLILIDEAEKLGS